MPFCPSLSAQLYPRRSNKLLRLLGGPLGMCDRFTPASFVSLSAVANAVVLLRYITIKASCQGTRVAKQQKRVEVFGHDSLSSPEPSLTARDSY